jgi:hypothetical protein
MNVDHHSFEPTVLTCGSCNDQVPPYTVGNGASLLRVLRYVRNRTARTTQAKAVAWGEASIPAPSIMHDERQTPLPSITRVRSFELLSEISNASRLPVRAVFDLQGLGLWEGQLSVYMPTREEMEERQRIVAQRPMLSYL